MDRTLTPQQTASFGILLMSLWLFILGIWNIFALFSTLGSLPQMGLKVTWVTILIVILWKLLPLGIGLLLFRQHRFFVHLFSRHALSDENQNTWQHSSLLAALCMGLFGIYFTVQGIERLCAEQDVLFLILAIDNPSARQYIAGFSARMGQDVLWQRSLLYLQIFYPLVIGIVFIVGAGRIGHFFGKKIDKSLEMPPEKEDEQ